MTSASGWLKMSSIDKNLRNSEMGEVWARMNRTLTFRVGSGSLGSRRARTEAVCAPPEWVFPQPAMLTTPLLPTRNTMMVLSTLTRPRPLPTWMAHSYQKALVSCSGGQLSFPRSQHPAACWHVVSTQKCLLVVNWVDSGWSRGEWGGARWILMILKISQSLPCIWQSKQ